MCRGGAGDVKNAVDPAQSARLFVSYQEDDDGLQRDASTACRVVSLEWVGSIFGVLCVTIWQ